MAWFRLGVLDEMPSPEREGHRLEQVGSASEIAVNKQAILATGTHEVRKAIAVHVDERCRRAADALAVRGLDTWGNVDAEPKRKWDADGVSHAAIKGEGGTNAGGHGSATAHIPFFHEAITTIEGDRETSIGLLAHVVGKAIAIDVGEHAPSHGEALRVVHATRDAEHAQHRNAYAVATTQVAAHAAVCAWKFRRHSISVRVAESIAHHAVRGHHVGKTVTIEVAPIPRRHGLAAGEVATGTARAVL